jgi:dTDP-4-dehydrorhamnose reductase
MSTVLITGGSGFLGGHLAFYISKYLETNVFYHSNPIKSNRFNSFKVDITDKHELTRIIQKISPSIIIHCAAITDLNFCETNKQMAWNVNVQGTKNIAFVAEKIGARIIYVSTDLVFEGIKSYYSENDFPTPKCYYGKTKLEGENFIASINSNFCIARVSLIYGLSISKSSCFTEFTIEKLKNNNNVYLFKNEYRTPIYVQNICEIIFELTTKENINGLFHIAGSQRINRYEFGLLLADVFGFNKELITPVKTKEYDQYKFRPEDCSLNNKKMLDVLNVKLLDMRDCFNEMKFKYNRLYID